MTRTPSPKHLQAKKIYLDSGGTLKPKEIALQVDASPEQVRTWKSTAKWDADLKNHNVTKSDQNVTKKQKRNVMKSAEPKNRSPAGKKRKGGFQPGNQAAKGHGAPKGNKNAVGNNGGAPEGNSNAVTHGFFRRFFPDDEQTRQILEEIDTMTTTDMLWFSIETKMLAIVRAQNVMFVRDQEDIVEKLKREKQTDTGYENEWEFQYPWERHAQFLTAQARAMAELRALIDQFESQADENDVRRKKIQLMQSQIEKTNLEIEKLKGDGDNQPTEVHVRRWTK